MMKGIWTLQIGLSGLKFWKKKNDRRNKTRCWQLKDFFVFTRNPGEMESNLTNIYFSDGLKSPIMKNQQKILRPSDSSGDLFIPLINWRSISKGPHSRLPGNCFCFEHSDFRILFQSLIFV